MIVCLFWAISGITYTHEVSYTESEKQNIILIVDISRSMLAEDILPSRIEVAKERLKEFVMTRTTDNFGMIIFAGKAFLVIADSHDTAGIVKYIENITPSQILQERPGLSGTNIGDAILLALDTLKDTTWPRSIILFTDGSANTGFDPILASTEAKRLNVSLYTIGISAQNDEPIFYTDSFGNKNFFYDIDGNQISGEFDTKLLQDMAEMTDGAYFDAQDADWFRKILEHIHEDFDSSTIYKTKTQKTDVSPWIILFAIVCFLLEIWMQKRIVQEIRNI